MALMATFLIAIVIPRLKPVCPETAHMAKRTPFTFGEMVTTWTWLTIAIFCYPYVVWLIETFGEIIPILVILGVVCVVYVSRARKG